MPTQSRYLSCDKSLAEVSVLIQQQRMSPVEIVTACLGRIGRVQPNLNAFITILAQTAMGEAKAAEMEIQRGEWKGALHGVPIGVKDFTILRAYRLPQGSSTLELGCLPTTR